jgi:BA14K-like protein
LARRQWLVVVAAVAEATVTALVAGSEAQLPAADFAVRRPVSAGFNGGNNFAGRGGGRFAGGGYRHGYGRGVGFAGGWAVGDGFGYGYDDGYYGDGYYADNGYSDGGYGYDNGLYYVASDNQRADSGYYAQRYKSYDPASGTYLGYDGLRHPCE